MNTIFTSFPRILISLSALAFVGFTQFPVQAQNIPDSGRLGNVNLGSLTNLEPLSKPMQPQFRLPNPPNFKQVPNPMQPQIDLGYPRSSEKFFNQGQQQLEREVERLQTHRPATPLLTISPELELQIKRDIQRLEQGNGMTQSGSPQGAASQR
jgi:hypothetical protein